MSNRILMHFISASVLIAFSIAALGCAQQAEFTAECSTISYVAGTWLGTFRCEGNVNCISGNDQFDVHQDLEDLTKVTVEITLSSVGDKGLILEGTLCGNTFTWEATNLGSDEKGEWIFREALNYFNKTSTYTFNDEEYTCIGQGARSPLPSPPPYIYPE